MDYIVLFDVATKPRAWLGFPWPLCVAMLTLFFIVGELERDTSKDGFLTRNWTRIVVAIVLAGLAFGTWSYETNRQRMIVDLIRHDVSVVEGEVSNITVRRGGSKSPSVYFCFTVESERFCYNSGETTPALNACATPISEGLWVRVSYQRQQILRLEARKDSLDRINAPLE